MKKTIIEIYYIMFMLFFSENRACQKKEAQDLHFIKNCAIIHKIK